MHKTSTENPKAHERRCMAAHKSARFHDKAVPKGCSRASGKNSGNIVASKNGAPTEILSPLIPSSTKGYSVPIRTVAAMVASIRLLSTNPASREIGANNPPCRKACARHANKVRPPPIKNTRIPRMNLPRDGSDAKVCTEVSTPERTRNVPISDREKVRIDNRMVQTFSASRFSMTTVECSKAVPASHGISEAFSTGSQNQKPPQPNS